MQKFIFTNNVAETIDSVCEEAEADKLFVIADSNVKQYVIGQLKGCNTINNAEHIIIPSGEQYKNINTLQHVWQTLSEKEATRRSVLICIGGGTVTDIGGFAAATFKRGIRNINLPTTLLGAVDAAAGGKTGINFMGLKNEIGAFHQAECVIISSIPLKTLPKQELYSGYAEMLKHTLLKSQASFSSITDTRIEDIDTDTMLRMIEESVKIKRDIVEADPYEKGFRKALNLGHTAGHAFESLSLERGKAIAHGYAVAHGLVVELILSRMLKQFPSEILYAAKDFIRQHYGIINITCKDYDRILEYMHHDKKNDGTGINFTLLHSPGTPQTDCMVNENIIKDALDIYRDMFGI